MVAEEGKVFWLVRFKSCHSPVAFRPAHYVCAAAATATATTTAIANTLNAPALAAATAGQQQQRDDGGSAASGMHLHIHLGGGLSPAAANQWAASTTQASATDHLSSVLEEATEPSELDVE